MDTSEAFKESFTTRTKKFLTRRLTRVLSKKSGNTPERAADTSRIDTTTKDRGDRVGDRDLSVLGNWSRGDANRASKKGSKVSRKVSRKASILSGLSVSSACTSVSGTASSISCVAEATFRVGESLAGLKPPLSGQVLSGQVLSGQVQGGVGVGDRQAQGERLQPPHPGVRRRSSAKAELSYGPGVARPHDSSLRKKEEMLLRTISERVLPLSVCRSF